MSEPVGKLTVKGLGHLDICDAESLIIAEYFLDYIDKQFQKPAEPEYCNPKVREQRQEEQRDLEAKMFGLDIQPSSIMRMSEGITEEELKMLDKPKTKPKLIDLCQLAEYPKISIKIKPKKIKRGRKQGGFMACIDVIRKYYENKSSFMIQSFINRQPRFTEDEVKDAIAELIQNKEVYQISSEEIGIIRREE